MIFNYFYRFYNRETESHDTYISHDRLDKVSHQTRAMADEIFCVVPWEFGYKKIYIKDRYSKDGELISSDDFLAMTLSAKPLTKRTK